MYSDRFHFDPPSLAQYADEVAQDQEPTWIIKNLLPADNLVLCSGQAKEAKKSFFCMLTALVTATGKSLPNMECEQNLPVLYIYREGARKATVDRFRALAAGHDLGRLEDMHDLYLFHRGEFRLDEDACVERVQAFIKERGIRLVIIDTFAKSFGGDENNSQQIGNAIRQADRLRNMGTTVILVHHPRKAMPELSAGKEGYPEPDHDLRGSNSLAGAYETHWAIRSYGAAGGEGKPIMVVCSKEGEKCAYDYDWDFTTNDAGTLLKAHLSFFKKAQLPYIQFEKTRTKASNGIEKDLFQ